MTEDIFADRVAKVRQRFVSTLEAKIDETCAALPKLGGGAPPAATAVAEAYRCMHGIVGIGRTVGFPDTGRAAHEVERPALALSRRARAHRRRNLPPEKFPAGVACGRRPRTALLPLPLTVTA